MKNMLLLIPIICFAMILGCTTTKYIITADNITLNFVGDTVINKLSIQKNSFADTATFNPKMVSNEVEIPSDTSFLELYFDKKTISILKNIKKVESYLLNPEVKTANSTSFHNYAITEKQKKITEKQLSELQNILVDKENYQQDKIVKNCTFLPDVGFRCYSNDSTFVDILVAFYCEDWLFLTNNEKYYKDCSNARKSLLKLTKDIYLKDKYIQKLLDNN